jgi:hypothetical protein
MSFLKNLAKPTHSYPTSSLVVGGVFALDMPGTLIQDRECLWHVRQIRSLLGIPHALIEQCATGKTKTVAVSAIVQHQGFRQTSRNNDLGSALP